jgi:hypothetical protein
MIPTTALIVLIIVVIICTITMLIAIWHSISTRLNAPEPIEDEQEKVELPLTDSRAPLTMVTPVRSPTPEAESPPPLGAEDIAPVFPKPINLSTKNRKERDSMNEILDLYSIGGNNSASPAQLAPPRSTTFAEAKSKWAYFGRHEDYDVV